MSREVPSSNHLIESFIKYIIRSKPIADETIGKYASHLIAKSSIYSVRVGGQDDRGSLEHYKYLCGITGLSNMHFCWFTYSSLGKSLKDYITQLETKIPVNIGTLRNVTTSPTLDQRQYRAPIIHLDSDTKQELSQGDIKFALSFIHSIEKIHMWYNPVTKQGSGPGLSLEAIEQRFYAQTSIYFDLSLSPAEQAEHAEHAEHIPITSNKATSAPWFFSVLPSLSSASPIYLYNIQMYSYYFNRLRETSHPGIIIPREEEIINVFALVTWTNAPVSECSWERILFIPDGLYALCIYIHIENCLLVSRACRFHKNSFFLARKIINTSFNILFEHLAIRNKARSIIPLVDSQQLYKLHIPYSLFLRTAANIFEILSNISIYRLFRPFFGRAIHNCLGSSWFSVIESRADAASGSKRSPYSLTTKIFATFLKFNEYTTNSKAYLTPFWDSNIPSGQVPYNSYFMYIKHMENVEQQEEQSNKVPLKIYQYNVPYYEKNEKISFQPMDPTIHEIMNAAPTEVMTNVRKILDSNREEGCGDDSHEYVSFMPLERPVLIIVSNDDRLNNWNNELRNMHLNMYTLYCSSDSASIDFVRRYIFTTPTEQPKKATNECDLCALNNCPCKHQPPDEVIMTDSAPVRGRPPRVKKESDLLQSPILCSNVSESLTSFIASLRQDDKIGDILPPQSVSTIDIVSIVAYQDSKGKYKIVTSLSPKTQLSDVKSLLSYGFGANFKSQALRRVTKSSGTKESKQNPINSVTSAKKSQNKASKAHSDSSSSASESRQYTVLECAILKSIAKTNHLCATWPQKSSDNFTRRLQLLNETGYQSRWSTRSPTLTISKCACSVIMGVWCNICNFKLGINCGNSPDDYTVYGLQKSENSPSATLNTLRLESEENIDLTNYLEDSHNYYIKSNESGDDGPKEFTVIKETLSQAFIEPQLKMNPTDTILFRRDGKQILSVKRMCRQLPASIIVASFQATMRLLDVFSQIPFESIFIEEALEMKAHQYSYLDFCYNITSKYRFFAGRREFPIFTTEALAKVANINLSERAPTDLLREALLSLDCMDAEIFNAGLAILSFLIHVPKSTLLSIFQLISEALSSILTIGSTTIARSSQILFTFALLDFLDAGYLPEAVHSQIVAAEFSVLTSMQEKSIPPDTIADLSHYLSSASTYFAGYLRDQVKVTTIEEYKRKCSDFCNDIKQKASDTVSRHTPYRIFSVLFIHIQAYNLDAEVAKLHIPASLLKQLNVALTPFGSTVLRKSIEFTSLNNVLNTVRCANGLVCGCGLIAHNPDRIQQQELSELQALSAKDALLGSTMTSSLDSHSSIRLSPLQSEFLSVSKLNTEICMELHEFLFSRPSVQPAFVFVMQQTFDQVILQRVFFDIDSNVRRIIFDDIRPALLKKYTDLEVPSTFSKVSYPLYITVVRYTVFQLLIYLWTGTCFSLGEEYTRYFKSNPSCFNDIKEDNFFDSPVKYSLYLAQSRALQIAALTSTFLYHNKLFSDHSVKLAKAAGLSNPISNTIFCKTRTSLVYLVPDVMLTPTLEFLRYVYAYSNANIVTIVDVQAIFTSEAVEKIVSERIQASISITDDDMLGIRRLIVYILSRLLLSVLFDSIFTQNIQNTEAVEMSSKRSNNSDTYPTYYQHIKDSVDSTDIGTNGCSSTALVISVIPESLLLMIFALNEAYPSMAHPAAKGKNKIVPTSYDFTALLASIPFVSTRPVAHLFTKLCYDYQTLSKCPLTSISAPYIIQNVCQQSIEDSLLLTLSASTHTLYGEIHSLSTTLWEYVAKACSPTDLKQDMRSVYATNRLFQEILPKFSVAELIRVCEHAGCTMSQQYQANIGNQMSKLTDTALNLKPQSFYLIDPLVRRTVSAWLDCDLLLQGAIQHLFLNVRTTLRDTVHMCKNKIDKSLLRSHSMVSITETKSVYRQHYPSSKTPKRKDRGQNASADASFDPLKIVIEPTPFYVYYAGSSSTADISLNNLSGLNDINSPAESTDISMKTKDVAGTVKTRSRLSLNNSGGSMESWSIDESTDESTSPDLFRGSVAFSVISSNVIGTPSINAPLFSKIGRSFRKPEGPTLTPTEFFYTYMDESVEHFQRQASTQLTAVSVQNTLNVAVQPPIPLQLDTNSMYHPRSTVPRLLSIPTSSIEIYKESNSIHYYITSYSSFLNPLYTLDKSFPVCQECRSIYTREEDTELSAKKRKLLKSHDMHSIADDQSITFSLPRNNKNLNYNDLDSSLLHYCFICRNLFDPVLSADNNLEAGDVTTLIRTWQSNKKPPLNPQSIITPSSQTIFKQCKLYQESVFDNQTNILYGGIYQSNLTCLSYCGANEHESLCVQCIENSGLPPALTYYIYVTIDAILKRLALYHSVSASILEEYALVCIAAAYSYIFSKKCVGCVSEVQVPDLFFAKNKRDDIVKEYKDLVYTYQYTLYGRAVCEFINHLLYTTVTSLDGQESIQIQFMSLQQKMNNSSCQTSHPFDRIGIKAIIHILTSFFSSHIKKNMLQLTITEYSLVLARTYLLFRHKKMCTAMTSAIPHTLYPIYSSLRSLLRRCNLDEKIFSEQWLSTYDITGTVIHTNLRTVDSNLVFTSLGYNTIFFKYYTILRLLLTDIPMFLIDPQAPVGHEYSHTMSTLKEEALFLSFMLKHTLLYDHSLVPSPESPCYLHILLQFSSIILAYNGVHPCKILNNNDLGEPREYLFKGGLYNSANIIADNLFIYYFFTNVPRFISLYLEKGDSTLSSMNRRQEPCLCQELFRTFSLLEFSVSHVLADLGAVQFTPQLSYMHRLIRTKIRTISMSSPLALVDTTMLNQYIHTHSEDGLPTIDAFVTLFSCDYSWIYHLIHGVYQFEIATNQDCLALIQSSSEENKSKTPYSSISDTFIQKLCLPSTSTANNTIQPFEKCRYGPNNIRPYLHSIPKVQPKDQPKDQPKVSDDDVATEYNLNPAPSASATNAGLDQESLGQPSISENLYQDRYSMFNVHIYDSPLMNSLDISSISSTYPGVIERTVYQDRNSNNNGNENENNNNSFTQYSLIDVGTNMSPALSTVMSTQMIADTYNRMTMTSAADKIQLELFKDNAIYSKNVNALTLLPQATLQGLAPIPTKVLLHVVLRTIRMLLMRAYPMDNQSSMFYPQIAFTKPQSIISVALGDITPVSRVTISDLISGVACTPSTTIDGKYICLDEHDQSNYNPKRRARLHITEGFFMINGSYIHGGLFNYSHELYRFPGDHTDLDTFFLNYLINYMYIPQKETGQQDTLAVFLQDPVSGISMKEHAILSTLMSTNFMVSGLVTDSIEQPKIETLVGEFEALVPEAKRQFLIEIIMAIGVGLGATPLEMFENIIRTYHLMATKDRQLPVSTILRASVIFLQILWLMVKKCRKLPDELRPYVQNMDVAKATHELHLLRILQGKLKELSVRYNYLLFSFDWCTHNGESKYSAIFSRGLQQVPVVENYWIQCCNQYIEDFSLQNLAAQKPVSGPEIDLTHNFNESAHENASPVTTEINDIACSPGALAHRLLWNIPYYLPPFYYPTISRPRFPSNQKLLIPFSSQCYRQQENLQQSFNIIKQYVLEVHPTACAIDLMIGYVDYMYDCMMDPTYVNRYYSTPLTIGSLFTVQEYGLTELKNCWLYLTYCKIEFLEKFGLNLRDLTTIKANPAMQVTDEELKIIMTVAELINSAWSRLSDLKLLHAHVHYRGKKHQILMERKEYNCSNAINTIQLVRVLFPIFQQLTLIFERAYNKWSNTYINNDMETLLFPTNTLIQQRDIKIHPILEERWNAYYVHAMPWQAVIPLFSDDFLYNFDLLQRLRRVPTPEQIAFAIKQFSAIVKDRWSSILQIISPPVSTEFINERYRLLVYGLITERTLLSNLNEQYYNHDLNSIIDISRNIIKSSRSHVRLIASKAHPENRISEMLNQDVPSHSSPMQTTYSQPYAFGGRSISTGYAPSAPYSYQAVQRLGNFGLPNIPQQYRYTGEYSGVAPYSQERYLYQQSISGGGGSKMMYGASSANSMYYGKQNRAIEYYQRNGIALSQHYQGVYPQVYPSRYDSLPVRPGGPYLPPNTYGSSDIQSKVEQNAFMHQQSSNQQYPLTGPRANSAPGHYMHFGQHSSLNQGYTGYTNSSPYINISYSQTKNQIGNFNPKKSIDQLRSEKPLTSFGATAQSIGLFFDEGTVKFQDEVKNELTITSYRDTFTAVLRLLNRLLPSVITKKSTAESSERVLFEHIAELYFKDNLFFDKALDEDNLRYALGYMSLVREIPLREDEFIIQANLLINRINHVINKHPDILDIKGEDNMSIMRAFCSKFTQITQLPNNEADHPTLTKLGKDCSGFFLNRAYCYAFDLRISYIERQNMLPAALNKMQEMLDVCTQIMPISEIFSLPTSHMRRKLLLVLFIRNIFKNYISESEPDM